MGLGLDFGGFWVGAWLGFWAGVTAYGVMAYNVTKDACWLALALRISVSLPEHVRASYDVSLAN